jgi:hypothetical protein
LSTPFPCDLARLFVRALDFLMRCADGTAKARTEELATSAIDFCVGGLSQSHSHEDLQETLPLFVGHALTRFFIQVVTVIRSALLPEVFERLPLGRGAPFRNCTRPGARCVVKATDNATDLVFR